MNHLYKKWIVLSIITLVSFITNVDATIVIVGLPAIMEGLDISIIAGTWIITSYLITSTTFLLPAGRWADILGTKRIFIWGLAIFTVATALCGVATSGTTLIFFRFIKGIGAALALATATPIMIKNFPAHQLGLAIGLNSTSWIIGSLAGPVVGGMLLENFNWSAIFFVTVPFALAGMVAAWFVLDDTFLPTSNKTDWQGIFTFGFSLIALLVALSEGQALGWGSAPVTALFIASVMLGVLFVKAELNNPYPLFNLTLLHNVQYKAGLGITLNYCIAYFALPFLITFYLQGILQLSPREAGFYMIALSAPQLLMGPLGGILADRFGSLRMMYIGLMLLIGTTYILGNMSENLSITSLIISLMILSVANGLSWPALAKLVLSTGSSEEKGAISGMFYTVYNVGRALSQPLTIATMQFVLPADIISQLLAKTIKVSSSNNTLYIDSVNIAFYFVCFVFMFSLFITWFLDYCSKSNVCKLK